MSDRLEPSDREMISALRRSGARPSVTDLARMLGLARGTVQARIERLESQGVVTGYGPQLDAKVVGLPVKAFITLSISQGDHDAAIDGLRGVPEVVEVVTVTGDGDLLLRVMTTSIDHLHDVVQRISGLAQVAHTSTQLALATPLSRSLADVLDDVEPRWLSH